MPKLHGACGPVRARLFRWHPALAERHFRVFKTPERCTVGTMGGDAAGGAQSAAEHPAKREQVARLTEQLVQRFSKVEHIQPSELKSMMDDPCVRSTIVLVDTRLPEERAISTLPGALSTDEFEQQKSMLLKDSMQVIAYCTIGYRSSQWVEKLQAEGFQCKSLAGSILAWAHEGYPLVEPASGQQVKRVHTFSESWSLQPDDVQAVVFKRPFLSLGLDTLRSYLPSWLGGHSRQ